MHLGSASAWCRRTRRGPARPADPASPAAQAQLQDGDRITSVNGTAIRTYGDLLDHAARGSSRRPDRTIAYVRDGQPGSTSTVASAQTQRPPLDDPERHRRDRWPRSASGSSPSTPTRVTYGPVEAFGAPPTSPATWPIGTFAGAPAASRRRCPTLWTAITGGERDPDTPISVVGASRLGGEAVRAQRLAGLLPALRRR